MKKIVTVGGGTGSYTILSGLKELPDIEITALVSMADDGGSTGILRDELGVLPPGDVRQCLVALSEHTTIVRKLMNYRFTQGGLSGHSFGNIFLAALEKVSGNFITGVEVASEILKVRGRVVPVTGDSAKLAVQLKNKKILVGESTIEHADIQSKGVEKIFYKKNVKLHEHARKALLEADIVILGPGDYYGSLLPNIIVKGFTETLRRSPAKIIFPINLTNKHGHTLAWGVKEYVEDIEKYLRRKVDVILVNNEKPTEKQIKKYRLQEGEGVLVADNLKDKRVKRVSLMSFVTPKKNKKDAIASTRSFIRHDPKKLAKCIKYIVS
jgi:uncharacterized cofD-like protein